MSNSNEKKSILIVDDVPANIRILGESLKMLYKVRLATNSGKALEIAGSMNPPDLILLDIVMPGMDGYEICRRLKSSKQTKNIPVIFITAMDQEADETRGLKTGAVDYITKPFSLPIVNARIKTHLELKQHRDILENLSKIDGLTGIHNRRRFDEALEMEWHRAARIGSCLSLVMMDIDKFKNYNDTYGHTTGDDCLKQVANTLLEAVHRPTDLVARYGGEEFSCLLPHTDIAGANAIALKMVGAVEALNIPHEMSTVSDRVTISAGTSVIIPNRRTAPTQLINQADQCLYQAKKEGRNRVISSELVNPA
ncbi:MAG: PleD family two-component system response regulator [Desulfobacteraceae bacterium]|nr:PleD family two-component system response regulator [Desulfobacteraceae bacterium]